MQSGRDETYLMVQPGGQGVSESTDPPVHIFNTIVHPVDIVAAVGKRGSCTSFVASSELRSADMMAPIYVRRVPKPAKMTVRPRSITTKTPLEERLSAIS